MVSAILHFLLVRRLIMEEPTKVLDEQKQLNHSDLIDLYKHYWSVLHAELGFCHQYLNFYSGLLSAILAATLAGLLSLKFRGLDELTLLGIRYSHQPSDKPRYVSSYESFIP